MSYYFVLFYLLLKGVIISFSKTKRCVQLTQILIKRSLLTVSLFIQNWQRKRWSGVLLLRSTLFSLKRYNRIILTHKMMRTTPRRHDLGKPSYNFIISLNLKRKRWLGVLLFRSSLPASKWAIQSLLHTK